MCSFLSYQNVTLSKFYITRPILYTSHITHHCNVLHHLAITYTYHCNILTCSGIDILQVDHHLTTILYCSREREIERDSLTLGLPLGSMDPGGRSRLMTLGNLNFQRPSSKTPEMSSVAPSSVGGTNESRRR